MRCQLHKTFMNQRGESKGLGSDLAQPHKQITSPDLHKNIGVRVDINPGRGSTMIFGDFSRLTVVTEIKGVATLSCQKLVLLCQIVHQSDAPRVSVCFR